MKGETMFKFSVSITGKQDTTWIFQDWDVAIDTIIKLLRLPSIEKIELVEQ
jgi:hypothetical protein